MDWLDIPELATYKLAMTSTDVSCVQYMAPKYLQNYCAPVSEVEGRQHLRSAMHASAATSRRMFGREAFSVVGLTVSNSSSAKLNSISYGCAVVTVSNYKS